MIGAMIHPGILLALGSAILFGAITPFAKLLLGSADPWMMAGLLYLGALEGAWQRFIYPEPSSSCLMSRPHCVEPTCSGLPS
jgi:drug/metabolite transporter (DMT)-like permease